VNEALTPEQIELLEAMAALPYGVAMGQSSACPLPSRYSKLCWMGFAEKSKEHPADGKCSVSITTAGRYLLATIDALSGSPLPEQAPSTSASRESHIPISNTQSEEGEAAGLLRELVAADEELLLSPGEGRPRRAYRAALERKRTATTAAKNYLTREPNDG
jgi:hypothetical protein